MRKSNVISYCFLFLIASASFAQESIPFDKKDFPDQEKELRAAKKNIRKGDRLFKKGYGYYPQAVEYYMEAQSFNPDNALLNFKIGECLFQTYGKDKAGQYLKRSFMLDSLVHPEVMLKLGKYYHFCGKFDTAISLFKSYKQKYSDKISSETEIMLTKRIMECKHGKQFYDAPLHVFIDNSGSVVNSKYDDYSPVAAPEGDTLYFTSRRPEDEKANIRKDVYGFNEHGYKVATNDSGNWMQPVKMGKSINCEDHNGIIGISEDGETIYIYSSENGGDICYSEQKRKGKWSRPDNLSKRINTKYHEAYASFSDKGHKLFYVSDKPDTYGKHDIFDSRIDKKGKWKKGVNLGPVVNTVYDETAVYMHPDGKTLYFSSTGHNSMGGYDIFKTHIDKTGEWCKPENLGYPINTPGDDLFISFTENGNKAYIASERLGGYGGQDIYEVTFPGEEKQVINTVVMNQVNAYEQNLLQDAYSEPAADIEKTFITVMKGIIFDANTKYPLHASVIITDNQTNEILADFKNDSASGSYLVKLKSGKNYGLTIQADGYLFYSENIDLTEETKAKSIEKNIGLRKVEKGMHIVLRNIFFDTDKATLRDASRAELNRLFKIMQEYPNIRVEISGHTDNVGSEEYNKKLSERRAKAVVDYLVGKGINKDRLEYIGLGFDQPIATNQTEEGRQKNRRTEFKVISD
ncbi:MAG: OmpA family protein [Bacteroidales bacterium]|nr:OmpA family protein [Bacteroidales bacterium]